MTRNTNKTMGVGEAVEADPTGRGFRERMREVVRFFGSASSLALAIGVADTTIGKWLKGVSEPDRDKLVAIANAANISVGWLMTGEGGGGLAERSLGGNNTRLIRLLNHCPDGENTVPAGATRGRDSFLAASDGWIDREFGIASEDLAISRVKGDAMTPTLAPGDWLLVDCSYTHPDTEGIYILCLGRIQVVKRLQPLGAGRLLARSDNPAYGSIELNLETLTQETDVMGRVIGVLKRT